MLYEVITIVEIGTGSGIIAIMLAKRFPHLTVTAVDINPKAIELAKENAQSQGVADRIEFKETSLLDNVEGTFDLLVSNPPYIANNFPLDATVCHEPANALFGGEQGDELIRSIIDLCLERRIPWLTIEMGYDQKAPLESYLTERGVSAFTFYSRITSYNVCYTKLLRIGDKQVKGPFDVVK